MALIDSLTSNSDLFVQPQQAAATSTPWQKSNVNSTYFPAIDLDPTRWNQLYPYRLLVIQNVNGVQSIVNDSPSSVGTSVVGDKSSAIISFTPLQNQWIFNLPITPQQLTIVDQFAINTTATLKGILEEHSGLRFKMISAAGTMGVWPYRQNADLTTGTGSSGVLSQLFAGTIEAASSLVSQVNSVVSLVNGGTASNKPKTVQPANSPQGATSVGLYMAQALQQFLEQYAEAKTDPDNASWRLVFDIPKQNQSFIVTPLQFQWQQVEGKPYEILYNFQLKAWRRVTLNNQALSTNLKTTPVSPNVMAQILNTIAAARSTLASATNLIGAVTSDIEQPLTALRQTALFVKDLVGVAVAVADLPSRIVTDYASSIKQSIATIANAQLPSISTTNPVVAAQIAQIQASMQQNEGLSDTAVAGGQLGQTAAYASKTDPTNNIFNSPDTNYDLLTLVPVSTLSLSPAQQKVVAAAIATVQETTVDDLNTYKATIQNLALQLSNSFGSGNAYYSQVYGVPAPTVRLQPMTLDEYQILTQLYDVIEAYEVLTSTQFINDLSTQTSMEYVAGLASTSGIDFTVPTSMILAPVPFGLTVEQIAARYLGDPQRWLEIVTLNDLRDPYIDEDGFQLPLLSNAIGRQITIGSNTNLYLGQTVTLKSATQTPTARHILAIKQLSDTSYLVTLDGLANLNTFLLQDSAYIQAYLPGTCNSQQKIFIPSTQPLVDQPNIITPAVSQTDPLTGLSKVDLMLTDSGDIAVNNYGDFRFSYGLTNIIQALRIKVGTQLGKVLLHPEFGVGVAPGTINSEISLQNLYESFSKLILADPRFSSITKLQLVLNGPSLTVNLSVTLPGQSGVFPLSFKLAN